MDIYEPAEDSYLLQKYVKKYAAGKVLDLGTGSGIQALTAVKKKTVTSVLAVDLNPEAITHLHQIIQKQKLRKITVRQSDLFSNVPEKFDTIIFNPPYLPQDAGIDDSALYGGKKGWELSERFFSQAVFHLNPDGKILYLFSSLTNKQKIEELLAQQLLEFKELEKLNLYFEQLYVYRLTKSELLKELERKKVSEISYFTHGKRGNIFIGQFRGKKIALKIKRPESLAQNRIENEIKWLRILNRKRIGPRLLFFGKNYLACEFIDGKFLPEVLATAKSKTQIKPLLRQILQQCYTLDCLQVNKEELHRPFKHIIVNKTPVLIDFERCYHSEHPHNVTQFAEYLIRIKFFDREKIVPVLISYKENINQKNFNKILSGL